MALKIHELSQPIENGMSYFPGDPEPRIEAAQAGAAPWRVSELHLGTHTGTHIDAPSHFYAEGLSIDGFGPDRFLLPGVVAAAPDLADDQPIEPAALAGALGRLPKGGALAVRTDWDRHWRTDRYLRHPYLSPRAAQALVDGGVGLLAIDALNPDSTVQGTSHVHQTLLRNGILIVENLTGLAQLESGRVYHFSFLPLRLRGLDGSPVRAVAWEI
jgi:kynurenine formamidase